MDVAFIEHRILEKCYKILENLKENKLEQLGLGKRIII